MGILDAYKQGWKGTGKGVRKVGDYIHSFTPGAYAHKRSMEAWHLQNEYNTPANQIKRLKEAGLNKNLMYGQGTQAATGQASPAPEMRPTDSNPILGILGAFTDMARTMSATQRERAGANLDRERTISEKVNRAETVSRTILNGVMADKTLSDAQRNRFRNWYEKQLLPFEKALKRGQTEKAYQEILGIRSTMATQAKGREKADLEIINLKEMRKLIQAQTKGQVTDNQIAAIEKKIRAWEERIKSQYSFDPSAPWLTTLTQLGIRGIVQAAGTSGAAIEKGVENLLKSIEHVTREKVSGGAW
jgi:hypothetical protein